MALKNHPPFLYGKTITFYPIRPREDAPEWYEEMTDSQMHEWTGNTLPETVQDIENNLEMMANNEEMEAWTIRHNSTGRIVGTYWIACPIESAGRKVITAEAQRIAVPYWRTGLTTEARRAVYHYAFGKLKVDEIHAQAWSDNQNSCCSMINAGFKLLGTSREWFEKREGYFTENHYILTKEDYCSLYKKADS